MIEITWVLQLWFCYVLLMGLKWGFNFGYVLWDLWSLYEFLFPFWPFGGIIFSRLLKQILVLECFGSDLKG